MAPGSPRRPPACRHRRERGAALARISIDSITLFQERRLERVSAATVQRPARERLLQRAYATHKQPREREQEEPSAASHVSLGYEYRPIFRKGLGRLLSVAAYTRPDAQQSKGQGIQQREMTVALESALDARRQRILISHSSVSLLKWACLVIQAICVWTTLDRVQSVAAGHARGLGPTVGFKTIGGLPVASSSA
jgi:hypothetical protein